MTYHVKKYFTHFKSVALTLHDMWIELKFVQKKFTDVLRDSLLIIKNK